MSDRKVVARDGLVWTVISRNERATEYRSRFFMAARCAPGRPWHIDELDRDITAHGSAQTLKVFTYEYGINYLSHSVREICGDPPACRVCELCWTVSSGEEMACSQCNEPFGELHPWITWAEQLERLKARNPALAARLPGPDVHGNLLLREDGYPNAPAA